MLDISVIIPTFNRSEQLVRALESIANQRAKPSEIIVIDDGSTDDTGTTIADYSVRTNVAIRYLHQINRGPAAARNRGIAEASKPYLAFLDSDDEWHRDKLSLQYQAFKSAPEYLISHTKERWLKNGQHLNQKKYHIPLHGDIFAQSLRLCCVGMSTVMARRELFASCGLFNESLRCCEDYDFWLRVSAFESFYLVEKRYTIKHGGRPDQVSNIFRVGMDRFRIQALAHLVTTSSLKSEQRRAACLELNKRCTIYATGCKKHDKREEATYYLRLADHFRQKSDPSLK